ncbi:MAG: heavy-metal-associated domain-containing protein [Armatimonadetes bacterium]|nr:heavy-metal-associated domain-containing protein [Armatimonadota bacterium]
METTLQISGMTCGMCVQHVTQALQSVSGVQNAAVDLTAGRALVQHNESAEIKAMIEAVAEEGYTAQPG